MRRAGERILAKVAPPAFPRIKLADFGMAAAVGRDGLLRGRCGTPGYVAPEILKAGVQQGYGRNVDMFSAGAVIYALLCGYGKHGMLWSSFRPPLPHTNANANLHRAILWCERQRLNHRE